MMGGNGEWVTVGEFYLVGDGEWVMVGGNGEWVIVGGWYLWRIWGNGEEIINFCLDISHVPVLPDF